MRNAVLFGIVAVAGCGADVEGACQNYVDAWVGCLSEAYEGDQTVLDAQLAATEGACDAYAGAKDKESADLLNCYADTINAGDCSTPEASGNTILAISTDCAAGG